MTLEEKLNAEIKAAMLAKDSLKLEALRAIKSAVILLKTSGEAHTEEAEIKMLQRLVKQRKESAEIFISQKRDDLASVEMAQAAIIEVFLPKQLSEDELKDELKKIIEELGAKSPADMGKVMGAASKKLAGIAEGKAISNMVKQLLG
jgi:uncharacterized protein YqeY